VTHKRVVVIQRVLTHYRVPLFERLQHRMSELGVDLVIVAGQPRAEEQAKQDTVEFPGARQINNRYIRFGRREVCWQPALAEAKGADLVIVEQASRLLVNYVLLAWRLVGGPKLAWWGHGTNLNRGAASRAGEWIKRKLATRADWWFCYTEGTADIVRDLGVGDDRITVVQNAIDTSSIMQQRAALQPDDLDDVRAQLGIEGGPIAVAIGSIYAAKRPQFLIEAADHLRRSAPGFNLIVIGDGPDRDIIDQAAITRPWLHGLGMKTGVDLVRHAAVADVVLNPGLVGLTVLDAFALGLPLVTCDLEFHGPEVEYLRDGVNGLIAPKDEAPEGYADLVASLLAAPARLEAMAEQCHADAHRFTVDAMVDRFAEGIVAAIASPSATAPSIELNG
jgi:glycosyltransferase involved in cell wall biosynthesis